MLEDNTIDFRLDSEFMKKEYLKNKILLKPISKKLNCFMTKGQYGILPKSEDYLDQGLPLIRGKDLRGNHLDFNQLTKVPYSYFDSKYKVMLNDILILVKGATIGFSDGVFLVKEDLDNTIFNGSVFRIQLQNINPSYVFVFMTTKYFTYQKILGVANNGIEYNSLNTIRNYLIPHLSEMFQQEIEKYVSFSRKKLNQSQELYQQAERVLLEELGLVGFKPSTQGVSIKTFAQSFGTTGRLDAEYYQPKYDEMVQHLYTAPHNRLGELVNIQKSIEPGSEHYADEGMPFLRVSDLNKSGITEPNKKLSVAFCKENATLIQKLQPKKDTILFSKDGTVGIAHKLAEDKACITSGAVLHLTVKNEKEVLPDYLTLVLNSSVVQLQAERDAGGSIIQHWRVSEIEEVVIPVFSIEKQQAIAGLVQESFRLKTQSEALLEIAKRGVELAIETTETQAQSWMQSQLEAQTP